ncbi:CCA tRNA nucleotidyltransferase [Candidatus Woesearchaeota archaeon]|nr:CCA tRNA nucleotidyltransferase [Candidatus Woesearchaeota archaeon]
MKLFNQVLKQYTFSSAELERLQSVIREVLTKLRSELRRKNIDAEIMLGGSAAKGTFIKGDFDCDIFVRFHYSYLDQSISDLLEKALQPFKPTRVHGSRDYFQFSFKKIPFEIIPVLKVYDPKKAMNVTDMSPLHVAWVKKHLTPKLCKEIVLAKLLCKAQGLYGAESYINGFSGHVLDILIVYYGSFLKLLKASKGWKPNHIIDVEKHNTASQLNASKRAPLIIIDPVQPERNAAAALSEEKFNLFKKTSEGFLKKPSEVFFEKQPFSFSSVKKKAKKNHLFIFDIFGFEGKEDVVGTKMLKVFEHYTTHLNLFGFKIFAQGWEFDKHNKALFWFIIKREKLTSLVEHIGPPVTVKRGCDEFSKKYKKVFEKHKRLYTMIPRKYLTPQALFNDLIQDNYTVERVKRIKQIKT